MKTPDLTETPDQHFDTRPAPVSRPSGTITLDSAIFEDVPVILSAELGKGTMSVRDMLALTAGTVVPLSTPLDGYVELMLNGKGVARGELVAVGDQFAVRVTEILVDRA